MDQTPKPPTDNTSVFFIGTVGLCAQAVCVPAAMPHEEIAMHVNRESPTGIDSPWTVADAADLTDYDGPYPAPCPDEADRRHLMMHC